MRPEKNNPRQARLSDTDVLRVRVVILKPINFGYGEQVTCLQPGEVVEPPDQMGKLWVERGWARPA